MRILIVSKILVVAAYRRKLDEIAAQPGVACLTAITGPDWQEPGGRTVPFEPNGPAPYQLRVEPLWLNGSYHLFLWPRLGAVLREFKPDVVHIDEEPYNLATAHATWLARRTGAKSLFFTWQNLLRRYPPPFRWFERSVYAHSAYAIAGSTEALQVLRKKGYDGHGVVIPQFGVDPQLFSPGAPPRDGAPVIGFVGRLVEEKGILVLLDAVAGLTGDWRLHVIGSGPLEPIAKRRADQLGIAERVSWERSVPSVQIPRRLRTFSLLVQPSLTRRHWKEQFGRAVMEAMACGVPVVGSASGEIPNVIGEAGVVVREGDTAALRAAIDRLLADGELRRALACRARMRVVECFTHRRIAEQTVAAYTAALNG